MLTMADKLLRVEPDNPFEMGWNDAIHTLRRMFNLVGATNQPVEHMIVRGKLIEVDAEIAGLVRLLNAASFPTTGSCSGHGVRPGHIILANGIGGLHNLFLADDEQARQINALFPLDINGMRVEDER